MQYYGILVCFLFSLYHLVKLRNKRSLLFFLAGLFTAFADYYLTYRMDNYLLGVSLFCVVQTFYAIIFIDKKSILLRIVTLLVTYPIVINGLKVNDPIALLSIYSIVNLIYNVIFAFIKKDYLAAAGLLLFLVCDISVGLCNIDSYLPSSNFLHEIQTIASPLIWLAYFPSQTIIQLSGGKNEEK